MSDFKIKFMRQIEILGSVINNPDKLKVSDFEDIYDVNALTIKRDLQELRGMGINIHSRKGNGLSVLSNVPDEIIKNIIIQYIGIAVNQSIYDKATNFLINSQNIKAISIITILQRCINSGNQLRIEYEKAENNLNSERTIISERIIEPYCIFQSEKNWRLLAKHEEVIKQFILTKIKSVEQLDIKFKRATQNQIDEIFASSFSSWLGEERYKVKLKIIQPWRKRLRSKNLMEFQMVEEETDGSIIYEFVVNSLKEISSWIASRGEGIIVLEPEELRTLVIETAKGVLNNYD